MKKKDKDIFRRYTPSLMWKKILYSKEECIHYFWGFCVKNQDSMNPREPLYECKEVCIDFERRKGMEKNIRRSN